MQQADMCKQAGRYAGMQVCRQADTDTDTGTDTDTDTDTDMGMVPDIMHGNANLRAR